MDKASQALDALLAEREDKARHISEDAVRTIYRIEEQVQFDGNRADTPQRIREVVQAVVEKLING